MLTVMRAPSRYVQGPNALLQLKQHIEALGNKFFVVADGFVMNMTRDLIEQAFDHQTEQLVFEEFNGQCTINEIERLKELAKQNGCDAIIGIGGGRTFDTVKGVAHFAPEPENRDDVVESNLKDLIKSNFNNEVKKVKQNVKKASSPKPKRLKNT